MTWLSKCFAVTALTLLESCSIAASELTGSTVTFQVFSPHAYTPLTVPVSATVGPEVEFPEGSVLLDAPGGKYLTGVSVDIGPNYILQQYTQDAYVQAGVDNFSGPVYQLHPSSSLVRVIIDPSSTILLSYDSLLYTYQNLLAVDLIEYHIKAGDFLKLDLTFADSTTTPEPSSVALVAVGAIGAIAWNRKRNLRSGRQ